MTTATANAKPISKKWWQRAFCVRSSFDLPFFILVMVLLTIGIIMMFSASYASAYYSSRTGYDSLYYFKRQLLFAVLGIVAMLLISMIDYHILHKFAIPLMLLSIVLLVIVLFLPEINNVHRWINLGFTTFQPSEIAKFSLIVLFAHLMSKFHKQMGTFKGGVLPYITIIAIVCALVVIEPHLSATILIFLIGLLMMVIGGTKMRWFVIGISLAGLCFVYVFYFTEYLPGPIKTIVEEKLPHVFTRLEVWQDPFSDMRGDGWQTIQSLYAIASGGFLGVGLGQSRQKYMYISEPQNDFVFSVVCEELGFVGAAIIILLFALLIWRGFVVAMRAPDKFGALLACGITIQVGLQAFFNIAVVTNAFPNTGISLPFFSYGGTSLMMLLGQMGVLLAISRQTVMKKR